MVTSGALLGLFTSHRGVAEGSEAAFSPRISLSACVWLTWNASQEACQHRTDQLGLTS